jgi:hypothetical protein
MQAKIQAFVVLVEPVKTGACGYLADYYLGCNGVGQVLALPSYSIAPQPLWCPLRYLHHHQELKERLHTTTCCRNLPAPQI